MRVATTGSPPRPRRGFVNRFAGSIRWLSALLIVLSLLVLGRSLPLEQLVDALKVWIDGLGVWGPVAFVVLYVLATILLLPAWALTVAAGAMFGLIEGTLLVSVASTTGAALALLIARYLARERVARQLARYPKVEAVDKAIGEGGWKIVALLRLSPAVPFNLQNYLYGLTSVRFWPCVLTSWLAMLPGTFMYVYIGYLGGAGLEQAAKGGTSASVGPWALRIVGLLATIAVTVYITYLARNALRAKLNGNEDAP